MPFFADAAISSASPLKGTGAFVAAVTLNDVAGAAPPAAADGCGPNVPIACTPAFDESAGADPAAASAERSWTAPSTAVVNAELAEPSAFAASTTLPLASCVVVVAAGCGEVAAAGSVVPEAGAGLSDAVVAVCVAVGVLEGVAFAVTGAVAATAAATVVTVAALGAAGGFADAANVAPAAALAAIFAVASEAVAAASSEAIAVGSATMAAVVPASILAWIDDATGAAAVADWLAAIAAAAIANGAVALPDVGGAAGTSVTATGTGMATATAFATVTDRASCCADAAASVEEAAVEVSPDGDLLVDVVASDFEVPDFALECWGTLVLASVVAPEGCPVVAT